MPVPVALATKAAAIVAYRETNGPFRSIDELANVKGIGTKTVEKNRTNLKLEPRHGEESH